MKLLFTTGDRFYASFHWAWNDYRDVELVSINNSWLAVLKNTLVMDSQNSWKIDVMDINKIFSDDDIVDLRKQLVNEELLKDWNLIYIVNW